VVIGTANFGSFASSELAWADLKRRAFDIDVLACSRCGGPERFDENARVGPVGSSRKGLSTPRAAFVVVSTHVCLTACG